MLPLALPGATPSIIIISVTVIVILIVIVIIITRCVAVGTPEGYSLYSLNSTDVLDPVYKSGEFLNTTIQ